MFILTILFVLFIVEIGIAQSQADTTKHKAKERVVENTSEISTLWNIFYRGGGLGVAFLFCLYAYFELRSLKRQNLALQQQLISSYKDSFLTLIGEYKKSNAQNAKFLRVIAIFLKKKDI